MSRRDRGLCCGGGHSTPKQARQSGKLGGLNARPPATAVNCPGVWSHLYERFDNDR